jgi:hypothetical protein
MGELHPANGGRFVMTRVSPDPPPDPPGTTPGYTVAIYLPEGRRLDTHLRWLEGRPQLEPALDDGWAEAETLKLARVLRRTSPLSMTRWRGR